MKIDENYCEFKFPENSFCTILLHFVPLPKIQLRIVNNFLGPWLTNIKKGRFLVLYWSFYDLHDLIFRAKI